MREEQPVLFIDEIGMYFMHPIGGRVYVDGFEATIFNGATFYGTNK